MVVTDASRLPACIVARGIGLVKLKAVVLIPAHVQQRYTKGPSLKEETPEFSENMVHLGCFPPIEI